MSGKSHNIAILIALALSTALLFPESIFALGEPAAPRPIPIFVNEQLVGDSCADERTVFLGVIRPAGFEGGVNLTLVDLPEGITGSFVPNPVALSGNDNYTMLIVNVSHSVPLGRYTLRIRLVPLPDSNYGAWGVKDNSLLDTNVTLNVVHPCYDSPITQYNLPSTTTTTTLFGSTTTTTTTMVIITSTIQAVEHPPLLQITTTTSTTTKTTTLTNTTTERVTDSSIYAWALGATVIAAVLALVLLRKKG